MLVEITDMTRVSRWRRQGLRSSMRSLLFVSPGKTPLSATVVSSGSEGSAVRDSVGHASGCSGG